MNLSLCELQDGICHMMPCQLSKLEQINFQYGYSEPFQEQFPV